MSQPTSEREVHEPRADGGTGCGLVHRLHDTEIAVAGDSIRAVEALAEYFGYLEGGWPGEPSARLSLTVLESPSSDWPTLHPRSARQLPGGLEAWRGDDGTLHARLGDAAMGEGLPASGLATLRFDPARTVTAAQVRDLASLYLVESLRVWGRFPLHASAAVREGEAVLALGGSGAGKTTLALGLSRSGFAVATDDWLLYEAGGRAFPLVRSVSVPIDQVEDESRYAVLARHDEPPLPKLIVARESLGAVAPPTFRPRLVVHVRRCESEVSEVRQVHGRELLAAALGQSAIATADATGLRAQIGALSGLLARARCLELWAGRDIGADPARGGRMLARHFEEAGPR